MKIGVDLVKMERIEALVEKHKNFPVRFFTPKEVKYYQMKNAPVSFLAGNFAIKEALSKALGTGLVGFSLSDIEVLRDSLGAPTVTVYGPLKEIFRKKGITDILASISHDGEYAVGMVVLL